MKKIILGIGVALALVMFFGVAKNSNQEIPIEEGEIVFEETKPMDDQYDRIDQEEDIEEEFIAPGFEAAQDNIIAEEFNTDDQVLDEERFSGVLTEYNTGCFADGECYVVVDGKKITTIIGWSQDISGSIQGFTDGDISTGIGQEVEVYVAANGDGTFSLYGKEDYYIKLK